MNLLKITPLNFKCDVQIVIPAKLLIMHIYFPTPSANTGSTLSVVCFSFSCLIKVPEVSKSLLENSQVILTGEPSFTTENLTITKSPELIGSVPNIYGRRTIEKGALKNLSTYSKLIVLKHTFMENHFKTEIQATPNGAGKLKY
jgi:hypothetical protein